MSKITTEDCKNFLLQKYPDLAVKSWKRIKKYKNEQGHWCRDFEHATGVAITLFEINDALQLGEPINLNISIPVDDTSPILYYKSFDPALVKKGFKMVKKYVTEYLEYVPSSDMAGYETIPNSVVFFFNNIADPSLILHGGLDEDVSISIYPNYGQFTDHIDELIGEFLPDYLSEVCECEFAPWFDDNSQALTAAQIMEDLLKRGFVYESKECSLKNTYGTHKLVPKIEVVVKDLVLEAEVLKAIKNDDSKAIAALIDDNKIPVNYMVKNTTILYTAFKNDKVGCFREILKRIPNFANYDSNKKNVLNEIYQGYVNKQQQLKYLNIILNEANMDFSKKRNNDQFALINSIFVHKTSHNGVVESIEPNNLKNDIMFLKNKLSDFQYGEMILFFVLRYYPATQCEEFVDIACNFIDTYKQDAISLAIEVALYQGSGFDSPLDERIFNKLAEYNLNVGDKTLIQFVTMQRDRSPLFIIERFFRDENGNKIVITIDPEVRLEVWNRYLKKCK